ncbi:MAG: lysophospholipase [Anaerolineales bacterium]|nr:lysophospholipase [Anaerolineales bacterium]MCX7754996.1 lysophospholipase [Anaerolineales bacterium]MDW8277374.1 alpha/beta hydrolase [Anaerolineales bacterium]
MMHAEGQFQTPQGAKIYYQHWQPQSPPKALLLLVHGLAEHSGRYLNVVNSFVPRGYAVYGLDHIGHGKSEGTRVYVEQFADYIRPLETYFEMLRAWHPETPVFLVGHSLGGLIASVYLLEHQEQFRGAILSAPAVKISDSISPATIAIGKILSRLLPRAGILALDATAISKDEAVVRAYVNDPLVYTGKVTARLGAEMLAAMQRVTAEARTLRLPLLLLQGSADRLVDPGGARMLYEHARSTDKTLKVYDGLYHEVFNEPEREQVFADMAAWLEARC